MGFVALFTWSGAALAGLYMLAVWLIENDVSKRGAAPSRLPVPVMITHMLLAVTGLLVWVAYLLLDERKLAWAAVGILAMIVLLGLTMFARWIPVYRGTAVAAGTPAGAVGVPAGAAGRPAGGGGPMPGSRAAAYEVPAEGNFPVFMVFAHGLLAMSTLVLVVLTTIGIGGS
jgi:hypothetical protein